MSKYFTYFPKTVYNLEGSKSLDVITNLTSSFSFDANILENAVSYYEYSVPDGETPEIVAHKVYGDVEKHWVILKMNGIVDVKTDWPIEQRMLDNVVHTKYKTASILDGLAWAKANNHSYYKIETRLFPLTREKTETKIQITAAAYANLTASSSNYTLSDGNALTVSVDKTVITYYEHEVELNDDKRNIKILRNEFISEVDREFIRVISNV